MAQRYLYVLFVVFFSLGGQSVHSQNYEVDTISIREVISRWNEAHNQINEDAFNELYASTVLFYANYLDKKVCLAKKLTLLKKDPFEQHLGSDLQLMFYDGGVVYCGFTKEVSIGKEKKSYPSYLLLKRFGDEYLITGESDLLTDRNLKFRLALGVQTPVAELSSVHLPRRQPHRSTVWMVALAVLLSTAGVVIYFFGRRTLRTSAPKQEVKSPPTSYKEKVNKERPSARQTNPIKRKAPAEQERPDNIEYEKGLKFEHYVVNRFRLHSDLFKWIDATSDKGTRGHYPESNQNPDLQYEFRLDGRSYPFSVECKFRSANWGSIQITNDDQLERYTKFGMEKGMEVFIVLGLGGKPEKPDELFVIPIAEADQRMDKKSLLPYRAYPSFYYNREQRRLY
jgi:hypothetical protein